MKYILVREDMKIVLGRTLYRIRYLRECGWSSPNTFGGYIESESNLSQEDNAWVGECACVFDGGRVEDNAKVYGHVWVHENSIVKGNASVFDYATIKRCSVVTEDSRVFGNYVVYNDTIYGTQKRVRYV